MPAKHAQLLGEDDAVSPVIGVILMVAITVILAAVIATFVLGIGDTSEVAPQNSFSTDVDTDELSIQITSGQSIDIADLELRGLDGDWDDTDDAGPFHEFVDAGNDDTWGVGESVTFETSEFVDGGDGEAEVSANLVWVGDGEDVIYTIDETVPLS